MPVNSAVRKAINSPCRISRESRVNIFDFMFRVL
jgi:hypothetical protein